MSFDSRDFRDALGCFATGVCVVTGEDADGSAFGITINSFASVSLDPPLILWSLQHDSDMFDVFEQQPRWAVNILRREQELLSGRYARRGDHGLEPGHRRQGVSGMPVLADALVSLECELESRYAGGDHVILLARVLEFSRGDSGEPLVFCAGGYRELAQQAQG